jgi:tetratricopeptide (TPR) repeat protein
VNPFKRDSFAAVAIFGLVFLVYWPVLHGEFIWDDFLLVGQNPLVTGRLGPGTVWFGTSFPLTTLAFWAQYLAWGMNAHAFHVVNVTLHALNAVLLWRLLARLQVRGAWLGAVLFAVHPVCVATVAWISELKNTLSLCFFLLSFLWYLRFTQQAEPKVTALENQGTARVRRARLFYALSLVAFVLSLLSKTSTVVLPVVLLATAWWQRRRLQRADLLRTAPYFALGLGFGLMTIWMQQREAIKGATVQMEGLWGRLAGAGWALWFYLGKALAPVNLSLIYSRWEIDTRSLWAYLPVLAWGAGLALCWRFRSGLGRHLLFGLGCYTLALLPVLGFLDMYYLSISRVADHFQYLALIAPTALVAAGLSFGFSSFREDAEEQATNPLHDIAGAAPTPDAPTSAAPAPEIRESAAAPFRPRVQSAAVVFAIVVVTTLSVQTLRRSHVFSTEEKVWQDTLARNPAAWPARNNLGVILAGRQRYEEARAQFESSLRLNQHNANAHANLGQLLEVQGKSVEAEAHFLAALKINPQSVEAHKYYASALMKQGRSPEALPHLREALRLAPDMDTRLQYAGLLKQTGDARGAVAQLRQVLSVKPDLPEALNNLAWLLATSADASLRNGAEAVRLAERACRLTEYQAAPMLGTLAAAYAEAGRFTDAVATAEKLDRMATEAKDTRLLALNRQLLALYRAGKPFHEKAKP